MTPTIDQLIAEARRSLPQLNEARLRDAYSFADAAHGGQLRKSGEPYIVHPLTAALHLTTLPVDEDTLVACLLHDVPEDTPVTSAEVRERFGPAVASLVEGITKLSLVYYKNDMEERQVESMRKMFLVMARDLRVVLIKLADRLHNMQTLHWVDPEKRVRIARETLEIYAPLADRLGIWQFKWQLEDLCFRHLYPLEEAALRRSLTEGQEEREAYIARVEQELQQQLAVVGIAGVEMNGRTKHLYSIFHKMQRKQKTLAEIYDLFALRVIVPSTPDCYSVLGIIHDLWKPKPGRFKDYIAVPKPNGYQSLHTTVFCVDGRLTEFQIRTRDMHHDAEFGAPAHWFYNETKGQVKAGSKPAHDPSDWMKSILELNESNPDSHEFLEGLRLDVFNDRIFIFTPRGDVKDLPKGATALDFAYLVHTDVGHRTQGVKINGSIATLATPLKTGDVVEVITGKVAAPKRDWMKMVRTSQARTKIRTFLKTQNRAHNISVGRGLLDRALDLAGKDRSDRLSAERWKPVLEALNVKTTDDVLAGIGEGTFPTLPVLKRLFRPEELLTEVPARRGVAKRASARIYIQGSGDLDSHPAKCCMPKVGEKIVALVTKSKGITIHRADCRALRNSNPERLIHASWEAPVVQHRYTASLELVCAERPGLTRDILQELSQVDVVVLRLEVLGRTTDELTELLDVEIPNLDVLARLFDALEHVPGVRTIRRRPSAKPR